MRILGTIAVGIVALLASPALAELPVVNESHVSWQGCDFAIKVLQDVQQDYPYPQTLYRISVQSTVVSSATCSVTPSTTELGTSKLMPQIAIAANAEGLAVAFSFGEYNRNVGNWVRIRVYRLDPSSLGIYRIAGLQASYVPENGGAGMPGATSLQELTLHPGYIEVNGTFTGNSVTEDPATTPWPYPILQGNRFVAIYPDFFTWTPQSPRIVTF
jgi:hypothetical protein